MNEMKPYEAVLWDWFLPKAVIRTIYGVDRERTETFRRHLRICGIDADISNVPTVGLISEFAGTDAGNDESEGIVTDRWSCQCGGWDDRSLRDSLVIDGPINLSRTMYEIIQTGLGNHLLERLTAPEPPQGLADGFDVKPG